MKYDELLRKARERANKEDFAGKFGERLEAREKRFKAEANSLKPKDKFFSRSYSV